MSPECKEVTQKISSNEIVASLIKQMDTGNKDSHELSDPQITSFHCRQTAYFAIEVANFLGIKDEETLQAITLGALLHDTGKSGKPIEDLHHPGPLTTDERDFLLDHPVKGAIAIRQEIQKDRIEDNNSFCFPALPWEAAIAAVALHHTLKSHDSYPSPKTIEQLVDNGTLSQNAINTVEKNNITKIVAICDVFSALIANRPYAFESFRESNITSIIKDELGLTLPKDIEILNYLLDLDPCDFPLE